jgi:hypothetical protein
MVGGFPLYFLGADPVRTMSRAAVHWLLEAQ